MPENTTPDAAITTEEDAREFITKSAVRIATLDRLIEGPATATEIAANRPVGVASTKTATEELRDRNLIELLIDGDDPVYGITAKGERTMFFLETGGEI